MSSFNNRRDLANYLDRLTDEQRNAVTAPTDRPALALASAGAGKTETLVRRSAFLIRDGGFKASELLLTTFTKAAAEEITQRARRFIGSDAVRMRSGTIHSFCLNFLRDEMRKADVVSPLNQMIFLSKASEAVQEELGIEPKDERYRGRKFWEPWIEFVETHPTQILDERPRNDFGRLRDVSDLIEERMAHSRPEFATTEETAQAAARVWARYEALKSEQYDFTDMMTATFRLLQDPGVRDAWRQKVRYVLVDEVQDTSKLQHDILRIVAEDERLFIVGDDAQSLYGFRAATPELNVYGFKDAFPNGVVYPITTNFRSTGPIVEVSNRIIAANYQDEARKPYHKIARAFAEPSPDEVPVRLDGYNDDVQEAEAIAKEIRTEVQKGRRRFSDYYVLYRVNAQSEPLERALVEQGIPVITRGGSFYNRKRVADCISYIELAHDTRDDASFLRVFDIASELHPTPTRYLGNAFVTDCKDAGKASLWEGMMSIYPRLWRNKQQGTDDLRAYVGRLQSLILEEADPETLLDTVIATYRNHLKRRDGVDQDDETEDLDQLLVTAKRFYTWEDFSAYVQLMRETVERSDKDRDAVTLLTAHGAKGLERNVVYVVGMSENVLPHWMSSGAVCEMEVTRDGETYVVEVQRDSMPPSVYNGTVEEERCVAFVLVSRAREELRLSWTRRIGRRVNLTPSRFLIEAGLIERCTCLRPGETPCDMCLMDDAPHSDLCFTDGCRHGWVYPGRPALVDEQPVAREILAEQAAKAAAQDVESVPVALPQPPQTLQPPEHTERTERTERTPGQIWADLEFEKAEAKAREELERRGRH